MIKRQDGLWHCTICEYSSYYTTSVSRHIESRHLEASQYMCKLCHKICANRNALKCHNYQYHSSNKHWTIFLLTDFVDVEIQRRMIKLVDGRFQCSDCYFISSHNSTMKCHIESKHLETSGYSCNICNKFCPTRNALKCHKYRIHSKLGQ